MTYEQGMNLMVGVIGWLLVSLGILGYFGMNAVSLYFSCTGVLLLFYAIRNGGLR